MKGEMLPLPFQIRFKIALNYRNTDNQDLSKFNVTFH